MPRMNKKRTYVTKELTNEVLDTLNDREIILAELFEERIVLWEITDKELIIWRCTSYIKEGKDAFYDVYDQVRTFMNNKKGLYGCSTRFYGLGTGHKIYVGPLLSDAFEYLHSVLSPCVFRGNLYTLYTVIAYRYANVIIPERYAKRVSKYEQGNDSMTLEEVVANALAQTMPYE